MKKFKGEIFGEIWRFPTVFFGKESSSGYLGALGSEPRDACTGIYCTKPGAGPGARNQPTELGTGREDSSGFY